MATAIRNRVPHIILLYWVIKIAATTLGETGADMFSMTWRLGYADTIAIFFALFLVLFAVKLGIRGYHPAVYWLTFTGTAIVGTAISDFIDRRKYGPPCPGSDRSPCLMRRSPRS